MSPASHAPEPPCARCRLQSAFCVCAALPRIQTDVAVVVVRHWKERHRTSNTGRLVHLCIPDSLLVDFGARGETFDPRLATPPGAWLVFPRGSEDATDAPPEPRVPDPSHAEAPPQSIVLLDGSWGQARRMSHRIPGLSDLPRLALPPPRGGVRRLRKPHVPWAVSTVEAAALALSAVGEQAACDGLYDAFDLVVSQVRAQAGRYSF